jgi:hypothetical protein
MARSFASLQAIGQTPVVIGLELALVLVAAWALYAVATRALRRAGRTGSFAETTRALQLRVRNGLIATSLLLALLILGYNGWLLAPRASSAVCSQASKRPSTDRITSKTATRA